LVAAEALKSRLPVSLAAAQSAITQTQLRGRFEQRQITHFRSVFPVGARMPLLA